MHGIASRNCHSKIKSFLLLNEPQKGVTECSCVLQSPIGAPRFILFYFAAAIWLMVKPSGHLEFIKGPNPKPKSTYHFYSLLLAGLKLTNFNSSPLSPPPPHWEFEEGPVDTKCFNLGPMWEERTEEGALFVVWILASGLGYTGLQGGQKGEKVTFWVITDFNHYL